MAIQNPADLLATLAGSKALKANDAAYQVIVRLIGLIGRNQQQLTDQITVNTNGLDSSILTFQDSPNLPNSRKLVAGTNITLDDSVAGEEIISASGGGTTQQVSGAVFIRDNEFDEGFVIPGPQGAQGPQGNTGPAGTNGNGISIPGYDGQDGQDSYIPGPIGPQGIQGPIGPAGSSGSGIVIPGLDGKDGEDAWMIPGVQGPQGNPGPSGANLTSSTAFGSEPGSPTSGDLDFYNNALQIGRYSGSAWVPWRSTPLTEPSLATWAWINQGTATVSITNGGIYLFDGTSGTDHIAIREFTSPGGNFTRTFGIMSYVPVQGVSDQMGVCFRESSSGKLVTFGVVNNTTVIAKWTNPTTFSANYSLGLNPPANWSASLQSSQYIFWLRLGDDGTTNRTFSMSLDGIHFVTLLSQSRTDFMTPDQLGIFVNNRSAGATTAGIGIWLLSLV